MKKKPSPRPPHSLCEGLHLAAQHLDSLRDLVLCLIARVEAQEDVGTKPKVPAGSLKFVGVRKPLARKPAVHRARMNPDSTR